MNVNKDLKPLGALTLRCREKTENSFVFFTLERLCVSMVRGLILVTVQPL